MALYEPDRYTVYEGEPTGSALCTCWTDPATIDTSEYELAGTLYSREGVNILLRNLALNPQIRTLYLWGYHPLSRTPYGRAGADLLRALWKTGLSQDHTVANYRLHKELDPVVVENIIAHVDLVDVSELSLDKLPCVHERTPYMEPVSFPAPSRDAETTLPSEKTGFVVRGKTIVDAWVQALRNVMNYGVVKPSEYGVRQREAMHVTWCIHSSEVGGEQLPSALKERIGLAQIGSYAQQYLDPHKSAGIRYTYGQRLREGTDQVAMMIEKIKQCTASRRAVATTLRPEEDLTSSSPPCLVFLQVLVQEEIHLFATFRAHDLFKAAIPNAYGLCMLLQYISEQTGLPAGTVTITSTSAHVYEDDWEDARRLCACVLERQQRFLEDSDADPRGNVIIQISEDKLIARINDIDIVGRRARDVALQLAHQQLLSRADHYCDITIELLKAELAIKTGQQYVQDRPLRVANVVV